MAKHHQTAETKSDKKNRPKVKPPVVEELTDDLVGLAKLPSGAIVIADGGSIEAQTARLGDMRLQTAQRQALAAQIGRTQGNQHLQRVMASLKSDEKMANPISARQQGPGGQGGQRLLHSGVVQAKPIIGQPGDEYEQKVDRVAEQVMHTSGPVIQLKPT